MFLVVAESFVNLLIDGCVSSNSKTGGCWRSLPSPTWTTPARGSLRDAIVQANNQGGTVTDEITFTVTGTIQLQSQLPTITGPVNITGPGAAFLTLDAGDGTDNTFGTGDGYRIFNIDDGNIPQIDVTISGLTLTGGGIYSRGYATITHSTIRDNSIMGPDGYGGGLFTSGGTTISHSTISGNSTAGGFAGGGGVQSNDTTTISHSTISGNSIVGSSAEGGGANSRGALTLFDSIVLGNVSTQNSSDELFEHEEASVGGDGTPTYLGLNIVGTGSDTNGADGRINASPAAVFAANVQTLVDNNGDGTPETPTGAFGGVLADNGGDVDTIALRDNPTNPALDAGDASFLSEATFGIDFNGDGDTVDTVTTDARGFERAVDLPGVGTTAIVDLGAFERQTTTNNSADFDGDGDIDGIDFLFWQIGFGMLAPNATKSDGDADNDLDVDGNDLAIWEGQLGQPAPLAAVSSAASSEPVAVSAAAVKPTSTLLRAKLVDAAITLHLYHVSVANDSPAQVALPIAQDHVAPCAASHHAPLSLVSNTAVAYPPRADHQIDEIDQHECLDDELLAAVFNE